MYSLTALMKDYLLEIGKEIKSTCEIQGRTDPNMIDMLNVAYDYGLTQNDLQTHIQDNEFSLVPSQAHLCKQKQVLRHRAEARMSNVFAMKKQLVSESNNPVLDMQTAATQA